MHIRKTSLYGTSVRYFVIDIYIIIFMLYNHYYVEPIFYTIVLKKTYIINTLNLSSNRNQKLNTVKYMFKN